MAAVHQMKAITLIRRFLWCNIPGIAQRQYHNRYSVSRTCRWAYPCDHHSIPTRQMGYNSIAARKLSSQCVFIVSVSLDHGNIRSINPSKNCQISVIPTLTQKQWNSTTANVEGISLNNDKVKNYLSNLLTKYKEIEEQLSGDLTLTGKKQQSLKKRRNELEPIMERVTEWEEKKIELAEIETLLQDSNDPEMKELATQEKEDCLEDTERLESEILSLLVPVDEDDDIDDVIVELTAGVGGQEAMLFTTDMFEMYQRYAIYKGWKFDVLHISDSDIGGIRHATVNISGEEVYKYMKYEGGVHRVQRVPKTERQGRIHTSTMAVAILPHPKQINSSLDPNDLKIETKKASGAGGQHVNKTESAVRIVHLPTKIAVECQQGKSQIKNKALAMKMLEARIYNQQLEKQQSQQNVSRKLQVGTSARSEKIRTYNFNQDRVTDHRISVSVYNIEGFLNGDADLDDMVQSLLQYNDTEMLMEAIENSNEDTSKNNSVK
ncbi:peptide chain release factor 1-like, mitochondrial [Glandiceps talaboti]